MSETAAVPADRRAAEERVALDRTWSRPAGLYGWLCAADHKTIGIRYLVTAFGFFMLAGLLAAAMRLQLSRPENAVLGPDLYNQLFTTHGTTMMFLFAVPMMQGLGVYLVPLMVGTRNIAFPRLNAFSYWMYLFGGLLLFVAFALNIGPDAGWFAYVPLSGPGILAGQAHRFLGADDHLHRTRRRSPWRCSSITTIFKQRAPGMSLNRMPLFVWAKLVTSFMVIFAMPSVMVASSFLIIDRLVNTHFFNPAEGGDRAAVAAPVLVFRPPRGLHHLHSGDRHRFGDPGDFRAPADLRLSGCGAVAGRDGFLGFGLWVHHMFATGLPSSAPAFLPGRA